MFPNHVFPNYGLMKELFIVTLINDVDEFNNIVFIGREIVLLVLTSNFKK